MSGGREGGRGGEGGVKKCFLGLRETALLSAEVKKVILYTTSTWTANSSEGHRPFLLFRNSNLFCFSVLHVTRI
jgi:hypothetical protein